MAFAPDGPGVGPGGTEFRQDNNEAATCLSAYKQTAPLAYQYAGRIQNTAAAPVNNPVKLTLADGAVWNVTGDSSLAELTSCDGCTVMEQ